MSDQIREAQIIRDGLDPARAAALMATLQDPAPWGDAFALPPFFHHAYFWVPLPPDQLGRDGHPKIGGIIPDFGLPRRMWAGGRLTFFNPLQTGLTATRTTTLASARRKTGRTGPLAFVTLSHDITQSDVLCVREEQDLVYRADPAPNTARPRIQIAAQNEESAQKISFSTTDLFRYSALTFNGHRIHYDLEYAQSVEGYGGLVVHGPLLAQHLILFAERQLGPLAGFRFRAVSPLIQTETADLCLKGTDLWVRGEDGRLCMSAEAEPA